MTSLATPLLPLIRSDFDLDYTKSGVVISAFTLAYGLGHLPAGWLSDRFGPRIMVTIGIAGVAVAGLLVGLSHTYTLLLVFLALMGALGGSYHPAAPAMVATSVETGRRGGALGIHMIGGGASQFLTPLIAAVIAVLWDWRGAYIVLAGPAFLFGIIFYVFVKRRQAGTEAATASIAVNKTPPLVGTRRLLIWFIILTTTTQALFFSTQSFIPLFLVDHYGISKEAAAASMSIVYSSGFWAGAVGGHLSDRWGRIPVLLAICFLLAPVIYLLNLAPYGFFSGLLLVFLGVVMYTRMTITEAFVVDQTSVRHRSTILGICQFTGMEAGDILAPVLGYLIDRYGFYTTFTVVAVTVFVITVVCTIPLLANRESPRLSKV